MSKSFVPKVKEASVPEDGVWGEINEEPVLILSIPEWEEIVSASAEGFRYTWLYDRIEDGYLFCFRLNNEWEKAIAFPKEHAGLLLKDAQANRLFSILITAQSLEKADSDSPYLWLKEIQFKRHPQAGW
ncbi:hypothetical protein [Hazenella coriacea]|uniref:Uncharacterized protein n=1 Tax=Hazenella coriacea TaxID=1179467 RepID=A0A4R3L9N8_9BACL|nr:hypothetical protein [Hazenella coriacea]TCS95825.1 hypothetical protein EDD58_102407 [Hazenella coriacea]